MSAVHPTLDNALSRGIGGEQENQSPLPLSFSGQSLLEISFQNVKSRIRIEQQEHGSKIIDPMAAFSYTGVCFSLSSSPLVCYSTGHGEIVGNMGGK